MHNKSRAVQLLKQQLSVATVPWRQPTDDIREYYGEKIALYNLFLGHYTEYILVPSIVGIAFQVVVWVSPPCAAIEIIANLCTAVVGL